VTALLLLALGFGAGLLGSLMGLGGGIIVVPALTQLFGVPFRAAVAASLVTIVASSSASSAAYVGRDQVDLRVAVVLELATVTGALVGSGVAGFLPVVVLKLLFAALAFYVATTLWVRRHGASDAMQVGAYEVRRWPTGLGVSGLAGAVSGLLGVGGGAFKVPAMTLAMGIPFKVAAATSNFAIGVTAAVSAYLYYGRGDLDPLLAAPVVIGVFVGARVGTKALPKLPARRLQGAFAGLLLFIGLRMAWDAWRTLG
jgi:uncharacterized membrane protein YfcA